MPDTLSETEACDLLARLFRSRGYAIKRNLTFREFGVAFHIDGWDATSRVGFEFLTSEDDDHDDLSLEEYQTLSDAQQRGELSIFILDEVEPLSPADLAEMANEFLDEVAAAKAQPRRKTAARRLVSPRKPKKKPAKKKAITKKATDLKPKKVKAARGPARKKRPKRK